jgi:hypothetical protein
MHREFFSILPVRYSLNANLERERTTRERTDSRSIQIYLVEGCAATFAGVQPYFAENPDYVPFPLASFGATASLSSERNAVNKSSALTMNRFPSRCASTQKRSPCLVRCLAMP